MADLMDSIPAASRTLATESEATAMKVIKAKQSFKSVSAKQVEINPALADRLGKKRPSVEFEMPEYDAADIAELAVANAGLLATVLNNALSDFAKAQFAANPVDWSFTVTPESLNLVDLAASFESQTRGRVLTLENAGKLALWLGKNIAALVAGIQTVEPSYQPAQLQAIIGVVGKYTAYESKSADFMAKVLMRLEQIAEAIGGNDELTESFVEDSTMTNVFDALVKKFGKSVEDEISEDAL